MLASFVCIGACAEPPTAALKLAREVVKRLNVKALYDETLAECVKEGDKSDATELFESDPAPFGGLSPKSAYWPEVEGVFRRQTLRVCQAFTTDDYAEALARQLAGRLPAKGVTPKSDLETATRALQESIVEALPEVLDSAQQSMDATREKYTELMVAELTALVERYKREPK